MKSIILTLSLLCLNVTDSPAEDITPSSFNSPEEAAAYANNNFAGGTVQVFNLQGTKYMVVILHGSGVPDLSISAYKQVGDKWTFAADGAKSPKPMAMHAIVQKDNSLIITDNQGYQAILIEQ